MLLANKHDTQVRQNCLPKWLTAKWQTIVVTRTLPWRHSTGWSYTKWRRCRMVWVCFWILQRLSSWNFTAWHLFRTGRPGVKLHAFADDNQLHVHCDLSNVSCQMLLPTASTVTCSTISRLQQYNYVISSCVRHQSYRLQQLTVRSRAENLDWQTASGHERRHMSQWHTKIWLGSEVISAWGSTLAGRPTTC